MNVTYRNTLEDLLKSARSPSKVHSFEYKNCFGAVAGYVRGHIFISCGRFGVALKLPSETFEHLFQEGSAKHLQYFPNGHIKKEYAVLSKKILNNRRAFNKLLMISIDYTI